MSLYQPIYMSPNGISIDASASNNFSLIIQGNNCVAYNLTIYTLENIQEYSTGKQILDTTLNNNDNLQITIPSGSIDVNGQQYKWSIKLYYGDGVDDYITSNEKAFWCYDTPSVLITVPGSISTQEHTFQAIFDQTDGLLPEKFKFVLYDNNNNIIKDSGWIFSANLQYAFTGFLSGEQYKIKCFVENNTKNISSESILYSFSVSYTQPSTLNSIDTEIKSDQSIIELSWSKVYDNIGYNSGEISYVSDFIETNNYGLSIPSGSRVAWTGLEILEDVSHTFIIEAQSDLLLDFEYIQSNDNGDYMTIGYNSDRFYININGTIEYQSEFIIEESGIYLIALIQNKLYVKKLN